MIPILTPLFTLIVSLCLWNSHASAFCGFYVGKADTKLFNKASEVVMAPHGNRALITMANDFKGDVKEFAMVVPVPTVLNKDQIHIGDAAVLTHLADYSAPRLVEYFDPNPCQMRHLESRAMDMTATAAEAPAKR